MNMATSFTYSGHTGKYLEPAVGKANLNIFAMLREGLRNEFHNAFHRVSYEKRNSCFTQYQSRNKR